VPPYPSDHRSVVVAFDIPACSVLGDLTGDCAIGPADWSILRAHQHTDLSGLSYNEAYMLGDLNADFHNNHTDFALFKAAFEAHHGAGSFAQMLAAVPEPTGVLPVAVIVIGWTVSLTRQRKFRGEGGRRAR
jgi:hypothetical protein